ncbi:MAG: GNAT family N-acetyltransferase [Gemmatimonadota bacterium]|nr:GNAT family N-acetyltransferase [Gemmatimonadota bacterium]
MQWTGHTLQTERTRLVPWGFEDAARLYEIFRHPDVRRYLLDDDLVSMEWVRDEIAASARSFDGEGWGLWTIRPAGADEIAGFAGFRPFFEPPEIQLLYGLHPEWWGEGLATEAAAAVVDHAFDVLGFDEVRAATDRPNAASAAVLERIGMTLTHASDRGPDGTLHYAIRRPAPAATGSGADR